MQVFVTTYKIAQTEVKGQWVELADFSDKDEFLEHCNNIKADLGDGNGELFFSDFEGFPRSLYSENDIDENLFALAQLSSEQQDIIFAYLKATGYSDLEYALEHAFDEYFGEYDSLEQFGLAVFDVQFEGASLPKEIEMYFDFESFASDVLINDYHTADNHYFYNR